MKNVPLIKCPVCGHEYLPGEVYIPNSFFGKQTEVFKNAAGELEFYIGDDMGLEEEFICDGCGNKLNITANMTFNVEAVSEDFEEEYEVAIDKPKKIKLPEVDLFS